MISLSDELFKRDIRAVIFDLDDTLFPEIQYVKSGFRCVANQIKADFGKDCYSLLLDLFKENKNGVYDRALKKLNINYDKSYVGKLVDVYRNHTPKGLSLYADVKVFLNKLKQNGLKTAIITDGRVEGQKAKLVALDLINSFDGIIITDELGGAQFRKPSFAAFEIMCERLGVKLKDAAYIADNPTKDFYIGIKGVYTVRIKRGDALYPQEIYYKDIKEQTTVSCLT